MTGRVHRTSKALADLTDIATYLAYDSLEAADRFLEAAEETFLLLAQAPLGQVCPFKLAEIVGTRVWHVKGFPNHLIFYRCVDDGVEIARIIHAARNLD
jgi:toxin ParE1/3/4